MTQILRSTDARLGHPDDLAIVDIGCGDGELLELIRERCPDLASRARWLGIDVRPFVRPGIDSLVGEWPDLVGPLVQAESITGLVMAHEWLDEIPCDIIERDAEGVDRIVLVDDDGCEHLGPPLSDDAACAELNIDGPSARAWIARWWSLQEEGDRAEVGIERDRAWQWITSLLQRGTAVATDYGHDREARIAVHGRGTLAAYRNGRMASPAPDGGAGLTAHVALDACAAARPGTTISVQRDEITVPSVGHQPGVDDVTAYFEAVRLRDPRRLGGIGWLRWEC
jgi:SAM-dependent MidA family methyltransferase